jgi:hypothetical protein
MMEYRLSVMERLTGPAHAVRSLRSNDCLAPSWTKMLGEAEGKTSLSCDRIRSGMRIAAETCGLARAVARPVVCRATAVLLA